MTNQIDIAHIVNNLRQERIFDNSNFKSSFKSTVTDYSTCINYNKKTLYAYRLISEYISNELIHNCLIMLQPSIYGGILMTPVCWWIMLTSKIELIFMSTCSIMKEKMTNSHTTHFSLPDNTAHNECIYNSKK